MATENKISYAPRNVGGVIVREGADTPLVYDEDQGVVTESIDGFPLREFEGGKQRLDNVRKVSGIEDLSGAAELEIDVWGTLRVVRKAGTGEVVALEDAQGNVLGIVNEEGAWCVVSDSPLTISYTGDLPLEQSAVNSTTFSDVQFDANGEATIQITADQYTVLAMEGAVAKIGDDVGVEWVLWKVASTSHVQTFSGVVRNQIVVASFSDEDNTYTGEAKKIAIAEGNVTLEQGTSYPELESAVLDGVTYKVLTSAEAATIAQQYGYTPTYATNAQIDLLFVTNVLNNNSWELINMVASAGLAANYWAVGDTKVDIGTDNVARTMRIADMNGLYGKHVVFEQVELEADSVIWQASAIDGYYNNYSTSGMRNTVLPALLLKYSSSLQGVLTNTTYKVATNGNTSTLLELSDKLFLPAERELFGTRDYSLQAEWDALSQFQYYVTNNTNDARKKYKPGDTSSYVWWERSPYSGATDRVCGVGALGIANYNLASLSRGVAPVFAI